MDETKRQEAVTLVTDRFYAASSARTNIEGEWNEAYRRYRGKNTDADDEYFIPETYSVIETILPRLVGDFLNSKKSVVSVSGRESIDQDKAETVESLTGYQFHRARVAFKYDDFCRQALIYGTAIGKTFWDYTAKKRTRQVPVFEMVVDEYYRETPQQTGWEEEEYDRIIMDDPNFEVVPIYDFYVDPAATSIEDARFCIQKKLMTRKQIEELEDNGVYKIPDDLPQQGSGQGDDAKQIDLDRTNARDENPTTNGIDSKFEILEYWEDNRVIVVADRQYILRDEKNPYDHKRIPYIAAPFSPLPFEFYGIGIPMIMGDLQDILNDLANSRLENIKLSINKMWLRRPGSVADDQLKTRPGGVIDVNGDLNNSIRPLEFPDVTGSSYREQQEILNAIQNVTGASDYIRGQASDTIPKQTATEVMQKTQQASNRFVYVFKMMAEQSIAKIADFFIELSKQYITEEKTIKILGNKANIYKTITPEDIDGEFDIIVSIDPMRADEQAHNNAVMNAFNMSLNPALQQLTQGAISPNVIIGLFNEVMESLDIDIEKYKQEAQNGIPQQNLFAGQAGGMGGPSQFGGMQGDPNSMPFPDGRTGEGGFGNMLPFGGGEMPSDGSGYPPPEGYFR